MSFDWSDFLLVARELEQAGQTPVANEARLRCAVSRAYYAVFCAARNFLRDRDGHPIPTRDPHLYVSNQFLASADATLWNIGDKLRRLRALRNQADYDDVFPFLLNRTSQVIVLAEDVLDDLENL